MKKTVVISLLIVLGFVAAVIISFIGYRQYRLRGRPPRTSLHKPICPGVIYAREVRVKPRPLMIHVLGIDLLSPGIRMGATPPDSGCPLEIYARTTSGFLQEFGALAAVNGSFSEPFHARGPLDYYPHVGDPVNIMGTAIADGKTYSRDYPGYPALCFSRQKAWICGNPAKIKSASEVNWAVPGDRIIVRNGQTVPKGQGPLHPRTAAAIDKEGTHLWLLVVDGRQSGYSEGVSFHELADIAVEIGAFECITLDGGGSSTMVVNDRGKIRVLNAPYHSRIPMRERPVGNHIGVFASDER